MRLRPKNSICSDWQMGRLGETRLADGTIAGARWPLWIGRYVLDGMAIIDELHAPLPDGNRGLGITLRYFDRDSDRWVVEFLNVTYSFIRSRQCTLRRSTADLTVVVLQRRDELRVYRAIDYGNFVYSIDLSNDGGREWNRGSIEFTMNRVE